MRIVCTSISTSNVLDLVRQVTGRKWEHNGNVWALGAWTRLAPEVL